MNKKIKAALITGASSGIGKEFTKIFASKGYNLVLVSRTKDKLEIIANGLEELYKIKVVVLPFDLSKQGSALDLFEEVNKRNIIIDVLINNAGFGSYGEFVKSSIESNTNMLNLNILSLTEITFLFIKEMINCNEGKILNIASTGAFQPLPNFAVYAASKAYVLHFTEALHFELKGTGVISSALCPGPTKTGFELRAKAEKLSLFKDGAMDAQTVARIGYEGLIKNKMVIIPGWKNKILAFLANITPSRNLLVYISNKFS